MRFRTATLDIATGMARRVFTRAGLQIHTCMEIQLLICHRRRKPTATFSKKMYCHKPDVSTVFYGLHQVKQYIHTSWTHQFSPSSAQSAGSLELRAFSFRSQIVGLVSFISSTARLLQVYRAPRSTISVSIRQHKSLINKFGAFYLPRLITTIADLCWLLSRSWKGTKRGFRTPILQQNNSVMLLV